MQTQTKTRATLDDLMRVPGKAELIDGKIVRITSAGHWPGYAAGEIFIALREYVRQMEKGRASSSNANFHVVNLPNRESFSPDAAYYTGPRGGMKFFPEPPIFAVEVRSEGDYGPTVKQAMADKRADYFAAGTQVVWDVDLLSEEVVKAYRADVPDAPTICRRGEMADAEPAVPGWTMPVDDLFEEAHD